MINDSYGHRAGDGVLGRDRRSAGRHDPGRRHRRPPGWRRVRILLGRVRNVEEAVATAERILAELRRPIDIGGQPSSSVASIGIALASGRDAVADDLLAHADAAMYEAKAQGKDRLAVFESSMRVRAWSRMEAEPTPGSADRPRP